MHVAYIMWHFPLVSETFIQREIVALRARRNRVTVIADAVPESSSASSTWDELTRLAIAIVPLDDNRLRRFRRRFFLFSPLRSWRLFRFTVASRYHHRKDPAFDRQVFNKAVFVAGLCRELGVTHIHSPWADLNAFVALLASKLLGVGYTVQARAHDIHQHSYLHGLEVKLGNAERVITNTDYNVAHLENLMPSLPAGSVVRIYNGIPLDRIAHRCPTYNTDRAVRLITVARLVEQKGLDDLLMAYEKLDELGFEYEATIVSGPAEDHESYARQLMELHERLDLDHRVRVVGEKSNDEVLRCLYSSDLFVLPCRLPIDGSRDIIPNVLLEAMATGVPCISTRITGIPEIIDHRQNGLLVQPGDSDQLADCIVELAGDPQLMRRFSINGRCRVESRFDIAKNISGYVDVFSSLHRAAS